MPDRRREADQMPPIPDGGLSSSMPEWLRRPPAWRTLPDAEVTAPAPATAGELPPADTSPIDPRGFLTDDDLPRWLRQFGAHVPEPAGGTGQEAERNDPGSEDRDATDEQDPQPAALVAAVAGPVAASRFVPRSPVVAPAAGQSAAPAGTPKLMNVRTSPPPRQRARRRAWWQGPQLTLVLAAALVIALIVIVALLL